ncbi:MAG: hypothetical protein SOY26_01435 [Paludibacteraceae bacterium]|nr:hypothetical protein [Bacteroidales bacterium]MDY4148398.1 hypothetical protein [Paludibacteraceae bacterium]
MRNRFKILICSLIGCYTILVAQDAPLPVYHNLSVMPHTGQLAYSVNLFQIKDVDFDWPIGLTYTSDGFRPLTYSGIVGDGWTLQAGGSITREIIGIADDMEYEEQTWDYAGNLSTRYLQKGMLAVLRDSAYSKQTAENIYNGDFSNDRLWENAKHYNRNAHIIDLESDIYSFSFGKYSGKFIIDFSGRAVILSGDYVEIDLSGMQIQEKQRTYCNDFHDSPLYLLPQPSTIVITTLDGYRYTFGGSDEALEYMQSIPTQINGNYTTEPDIVGWMLVSIEAPNGRKMLFHYASTNPQEQPCRYTYVPTVSIAHEDELVNGEGKKMDFYRSDTLNLKPYLTNLAQPYCLTNGEKQLFKNALLDSITTSDHSFAIYMQYEKKNNQIYDDDMFCSTFANGGTSYRSYWTAQKHFLTDVHILADRDTLSAWHLTYTSPKIADIESYSRQYLHSIEHKNAKIRYLFDYNWSASPISNNVDVLDMYGYWIDEPAFGTMIGAKDPLGKQLRFTYQVCAYDSIRIIKRNGNQYISAVESVSSVSKRDAERILHTISPASIEMYDKDNTLLQKKRYEYGWYDENAFSPQSAISDNNSVRDSAAILPRRGTSSGIINIDFAIDVAAQESKHYIIYPYFTPFGANIIEYSYVKEIIYNTQTPNRLYYNLLYYDHLPDRLDIKGNEQVLFAYAHLTQASRRAKLIKKEEYNQSSRLCKTTTYTYPTLDDSTLVRQSAGRLGSLSYRIWIPIDYPLSKKLSRYETNGTYSETTIFRRDQKKRIKEQCFLRGDKDYFTRYTYPDDVVSLSDICSDVYARGLRTLVKENRIEMPIETIKGIHTVNQDYITAGEIALYRLYQLDFSNKADSMIIDTTIVRKQQSEGLSFPQSAPYTAPCTSLLLRLQQPLLSTDFHTVSVEAGQLRCDSRYDTVATYTYDKMLRPTSVTPVGQPTTHYSWDARRLYITTETTGAFTKCYTYFPYVGLSSETDARGITTYYKYDLLGNLVEVYQYDDNGKKVVLKAYQYHYATQDE